MELSEHVAHLAPVWARYTNIIVERGDGATLYATDGRQYLDFTCGIGVTNTGHCHPAVVAAIREQAGLLLHGQANIVYHQPMLALVAAMAVGVALSMLHGLACVSYPGDQVVSGVAINIIATTSYTNWGDSIMIIGPGLTP